MDHQKCYEVLGLRPGASERQVHLAYRRLALLHHPDRAAGRPESHAIFCQVTEAYSKLKHSFHAPATLHNVGACSKCGEIAALFLGMDRRRYCSICLLHSRRRLLPLPTFQKIRCLAAIILQGLAFYCLLMSPFTGNWQSPAASIVFAIASMGTLSLNFARADVIEM